jgi:hypothetical protein
MEFRIQRINKVGEQWSSEFREKKSRGATEFRIQRKNSRGAVELGDSNRLGNAALPAFNLSDRQ